MDKQIQRQDKAETVRASMSYKKYGPDILYCCVQSFRIIKAITESVNTSEHLKFSLAEVK